MNKVLICKNQLYMIVLIVVLTLIKAWLSDFGTNGIEMTLIYLFIYLAWSLSLLLLATNHVTMHYPKLEVCILIEWVFICLTNSPCSFFPSSCMWIIPAFSCYVLCWVFILVSSSFNLVQYSDDTPFLLSSYSILIVDLLSCDLLAPLCKLYG